MSAGDTRLDGEWQTIDVVKVGFVAIVTMNRPDQLNVMNLAMRVELAECFHAIRLDDRIRVLIITGAGEAFSAGGDANDFIDQSSESMHDLMRQRSHHWFSALWNLPKVTIAAVNGVAAGGGANLMLACDLVIASEQAKFGETFMRVGLMPDLGGLFLLPRLVGLQRAKELCLRGEVIDACEAARIGLVGRVVAHDDLLVEARMLADELCTKPQRATSITKAILNRSFELSMEEVLLYELLGQSFLFGTDEHSEALARFLSSRRGHAGFANVPTSP